MNYNAENDRLQMYKTRRIHAGTANESTGLAQRVENLNVQRRDSRWGAMLKRRNILPSAMSPIFSPFKQTETNTTGSKSPEKELDKRREMLKKWQQEKKQKLENQKAKAKPLFKVHHVTANSNYDLTKVYQEIKGMRIADGKKKSDQEQYKLVSSTTYKFKPPANVKPVTSVTGSALKSKRKARSSSTIKNNVFSTSTKASSASQINSVKTLKSNVSTKVPENDKQLNRSKSETSASVNNLSDQRKRRYSTRQTRMSSRSSTNSNIQNDERKLNKTKTDSAETQRISQKKKGRKSNKFQGNTSSSLSDHPVSSVTNSDSNSSTNEVVTPTDKNLANVAYVSPFVTLSRGKENARKEYRQRSLRGGTVVAEDDEMFLPQEITNENNKCRRSRKSRQSTLLSVKTDEHASEISSDEPITPNKRTSDVIYVSPFVTMSRGKNNARKEYHRRSIRGGAGDLKSPYDKHDITKSTSPTAAASYFSKLLTNQTLRLQTLCEEWNLYKEQQSPAEEVCDMINVAIGQTELLLKKKFHQFQNLINCCESGNSEKPVTCLDLHGFWDTVMIQVNNLDQRFDNLERLRKNNWEEILPLPQPKKKGQTKKRATNKTQATSSLRAAIQEARKKKAAMRQEPAGEDHILSVTRQTTKISTPVKTPMSRRSSLRIAVINSEAHRRISSPGLTMIKITQIAKSAERQNHITPQEAPRSILKAERTKSIGRKSKVVLFRESDESSGDKENDCNFSNLIYFSPAINKTPLRRSSRIGKKLID